MGVRSAVVVDGRHGWPPSESAIFPILDKAKPLPAQSTVSLLLSRLIDSRPFAPDQGRFLADHLVGAVEPVGGIASPFVRDMLPNKRKVCVLIDP